MLKTALYPFQSKYFKTQFGKIHYIDEGQGEVILFVHGTPTWSFLYRNYIKNLSKNYRCIALDNFGFGLSDKLTDEFCNPEFHNKLLTGFIKELGLNEINLVVHDFGGVIGLPYAIDNIDNIKKIVIFNTWLWSNKNNIDVIKIDKIIKSKLGKFLYLNLNFSLKVLLKKAFYNKSKLTNELHKHYLLTFPNKQSRKGLYDIALSLNGSSDWYESYWEKADVLNKKEILFLWGMKDKFINEKYLNIWLEKIKKPVLHKYDCGHFVQEEMFEESILDLNKFLESN